MRIFESESAARARQRHGRVALALDGAREDGSESAVQGESAWGR